MRLGHGPLILQEPHTSAVPQPAATHCNPVTMPRSWDATALSSNLNFFADLKDEIASTLTPSVEPLKVANPIVPEN